MPDRPDFYKQTIQEPTRERAVKIGEYKIFSDISQYVMTHQSWTSDLFVVPSGKTLYISDIIIGGTRDGRIYLEDYGVKVIYTVFLSGRMTFSHSFAQPVPVEEGHTLTLSIDNVADYDGDYCYAIYGWLE